MACFIAIPTFHDFSRNFVIHLFVLHVYTTVSIKNRNMDVLFVCVHVFMYISFKLTTKSL